MSEAKQGLTQEDINLVVRMIDNAIWKSEIRILNRVRDAIFANNKRITEQLTELGVINQE